MHAIIHVKSPKFRAYWYA